MTLITITICSLALLPLVWQFGANINADLKFKRVLKANKEEILEFMSAIGFRSDPPNPFRVNYALYNLLYIEFDKIIKEKLTGGAKAIILESFSHKNIPQTLRFLNRMLPVIGIARIEFEEAALKSTLEQVQYKKESEQNEEIKRLNKMLEKANIKQKTIEKLGEEVKTASQSEQGLGVSKDSAIATQEYTMKVKERTSRVQSLNDQFDNEYSKLQSLFDRIENKLTEDENYSFFKKMKEVSERLKSLEENQRYINEETKRTTEEFQEGLEKND
ncbi:hypothetical protein GC194_00495 [bacterium]|nr:hypothetical protein [bacterium]